MNSTYEHGCVEDDDEQDRYTDKTDLEANRERQADVAAANARRSRGPRTPPPSPAGKYRIPHIPMGVEQHGPVSAPWTLAQVAAIERWQTFEAVHTLTCQYHGEQALDVTPGALYCARSGCEYRQTWVPATVLSPAAPPACMYPRACTHNGGCVAEPPCTASHD